MKKRLLSLAHNKKNPRGFSLIELLITIGLFSVLIPVLLVFFALTREGRPQLERRMKAISLAREAEEAVRVIRESDWTAVSTDNQYYPEVLGGTWKLHGGQESLDGGFTRFITIEDVRRDSNGNITTDTSFPIDPSTKKITTTVHWDTPRPTDVKSTIILTRFENDVHTYADNVVLGPGVGNGDWCTPSQSIIGSYDLSHSGVPIAITAATGTSQDIAYTTTGNNASGYTVDHITVSHDLTPNVGDTNAITGPKGYGIATDGTYVYVNENNPPNHTVLIANTSDLSTVGYFDIRNGTGTSVAVSGNTGYTTVGNALYAFDITQKTGSRPQKGAKVTLSGVGNKVVLSGSKAYVVTSSTTNQLQIIDTNTMTVTRTISLGNIQAGVDIAVSSDEKYAYVVTTYAAGKNDFYIVDLQTNSKWGYSTNGMNPKGIITPAPNRALLVGSGGELYQVFDITTPSNATHCGGMSPAGVTSINAVAGVARDNGSVFSYIISDDASHEFQIIQGGPGGTGGTYAPETTFESSTFDAGHDVAFNYFSVNESKPAGTAITYQIAIKSGVVSGGTTTCGGVSYTDSDFITRTPGEIPLSTTGYLNPGQCLRYRVKLTTADTSVTPTVYTISFNYSK